MTISADQIREALAGLVRARRMLEQQLESHAAWHALRQLIERERKGDAVAAVDAAGLRSGLEQRLDRDAPLWRVWAEIDTAVARIGGVAKPVLPSPPIIGAGGTVAGVARRSAMTLPEAPSVPVPGPTPREVIRPRIKVKATSSVVGHEPPPASPPKSDEADRGPGTTGSPEPEQAEPAPISSLPPAAILDRIRMIDRARPAEPDVPIEHKTRADQALPVAEVQAQPQMQRPATKPMLAAAKPSAMPATSGPTDRLAAVEADLDEIMGQPKTSGRHNPARRDDFDDEASGLQVEEADVSIVPIRRELLEPETGSTLRPGAVSAPPVALSIRLKQEQQAAELDSDDYAAYLTDVGEADVEIVQLDPPAGEPRDTAPPAGRPVLKVISRD